MRTMEAAACASELICGAIKQFSILDPPEWPRIVGEAAVESFARIYRFFEICFTSFAATLQRGCAKWPAFYVRIGCSLA